MEREKVEKYTVKDAPDLEPIIYDEKLSAFALSNKMDLFATTLELDDAKQRNYKLIVWLPSKVYGDMEIQFEYTGTSRSLMTVKTPRKIYKFEFDAEIFKEYMLKLLQMHIKKWENEHKGFFGMIEESVHFYNDVLEHPNTVKEIVETVTGEKPLK